ncbi:prepilin peptidase-dependent protein [Martelella alba]|uniref:Prepilin peptidase-dependent protein n=1 Tax=Martelella alba TaxID=2590451 RepID=A0ABY2SLB2_9HYPH|nr:prepilin peptidase-dependent protein [Martelella alba]TKI05931.1 prepilin peptidase-dependent protein [Martelella alba]
MLKSGQGGYTLAETLCALAVSAVVMMAAMRLLPQVQRFSLNHIRQIQLARHIDYAMLTMEKDLRRAGMCRSRCPRPAVVIGQRRGETRQSCLLTTYAFYAPASIAPSGPLVDETFGYRLREGALEARRGVTHCQGGNWVKTHDPRQWRVTRLRFEPLADNAYRIVLAGESRGKPTVRHGISRIVACRNGSS